MDRKTTFPSSERVENDQKQEKNGLTSKFFLTAQ
jgi:hypothetical protein